MPDIKVDTNKMRDVARAYGDYEEGLNTLLNRLKASIDNLQWDWKGQASSSYTGMHFPTLYKNMGKYIQKVKYLKSELDNTAKQFSSLDNGSK